MSRKIVSILSEQLIPNVLFIKQMGFEGDKHIFLSTTEMERMDKSSTLARAIGLEKERYITVIIDSNSPTQILNVLENEFFDVDEHYIVNITGGTKMMSQMTFLHFWGMKNSSIYYWPIGETFVEKLHPSFEREEFKEMICLDLKIYFAAYGYSFSQAERLQYSYKRADDLFNLIVGKGESGNVHEIIKATDNEYKENDKQYLIGGWFEEWLYRSLKDELGLNNHEIGFNLKIKNEASIRLTESDNELDVAFIYKNTLYIIECKVFSIKQLSGSKISDTIYKLSSVRQSLGLRAVAIVVILAPFGNSRARRNNIHDTMKMAKVEKVFSLEDLKNKEHFFYQIKM